MLLHIYFIHNAFSESVKWHSWNCLSRCRIVINRSFAKLISLKWPINYEGWKKTLQVCITFCAHLHTIVLSAVIMRRERTHTSCGHRAVFVGDLTPTCNGWPPNAVQKIAVGCRLFSWMRSSKTAASYFFRPKDEMPLTILTPQRKYIQRRMGTWLRIEYNPL